jgi:1-acyl-sn-glycerol-3-phosphate acyltransferase
MSHERDLNADFCSTKSDSGIERSTTKTMNAVPSPSRPLLHLRRIKAPFAPTIRVLYRAPLVFAYLLFAMLEPLLLRKDRTRTAQSVAKWTRRMLRVARLELSIEGHVPVDHGLFISNHRSYIDILVILANLPVTFLCKTEVSRWPLVGNIAGRMGVVFVDRSSASSRSESLSRVSNHVADGVRMVAFPEGTTTRAPGMRKTYPGLFREASRRGFPLLPMVIEYADPADAWVDEDTLLRHVVYWLSKPQSRVRICFGPTIAPSGDADIQAQAEEWMRGTLNRLHQYPW